MLHRRALPQNISGLEFAGEVAELGNERSPLAERRSRHGDHRWRSPCGICDDTPGCSGAVPPNLEWSAAGAVPEVFITAYDALQQAGFKAGDNVLIHAVGSGVGLAATQLVRALGGHAFGTSRTPDKIERAKSFGLESGYVVPEPSALSRAF